MKIEDYYKWEEMPVSSIIWLMVKWFDFDKVEQETLGRASVESGVWITITVTRKELNLSITGQRPDIIKRRLIELLDNLEARPIECRPKPDDTLTN